MIILYYILINILLYYNLFYDGPIAIFSEISENVVQF